MSVNPEPVCRLKVAVHVLLALIVTEPFVLQPVPVQPAKTEPAAGVAVNVTMVPLLKVAEQLVAQLIPAGELAMVPLPVPALATARAESLSTCSSRAAGFGSVPRIACRIECINPIAIVGARRDRRIGVGSNVCAYRRDLRIGAGGAGLAVDFKAGFVGGISVQLSCN